MALGPRLGRGPGQGRGRPIGPLITCGFPEAGTRVGEYPGRTGAAAVAGGIRAGSMEASMREPDFDTLSRTLDRLEAGVGAAELDGALAGFLCAGGAAAADRWLSSLALAELEETIVDARDRDLFGALFRGLSRELEDPEFAFEPLLPGDETPIAERAAAMVEWCRGFLGGLGLAGIDLGRGLDGDGGEVVGDFGRIAATEFDPGESDEDDEEAYAEMVEYIRVGVMLLHQQFAKAEPEATRH